MQLDQEQEDLQEQLDQEQRDWLNRKTATKQI